MPNQTNLNNKSKLIKILVALIGSIIVLLVLTVLTFSFLYNPFSPAQIPQIKVLTELQIKEIKEQDLSTLNENFDNGIGRLVNLNSNEKQSPTAKNSWLSLKSNSNYPIWFSNSSGAMFYKNISGNFMVETKVSSNTINDITKQNNTTYSSGGLIIRDSSSIKDNMKWIVYNSGFQDGYFGTEIKTTIPENGFNIINRISATNSISKWYSNKIENTSPINSHRICRVGNEFRFYIKSNDETQWREEILTQKTTQVGLEKPLPENSINNRIVINRPDFQDVLQVGIASNDSTETSESRFDYLNFNKINNFELCLK